jgi:hypothetical protein
MWKRVREKSINRGKTSGYKGLKDVQSVWKRELSQCGNVWKG